ncbi:MAG: acetyltransferase [Ferruginibacter sp.]|uniref:GNAT family N-acetyltransferase n=1 Tax=Ferruginibacter sp. TaxID=1940288 RepID=UPI002659F4FD|nr:GNAT family N-acetyltransferase [Ferruginibacter sp.]MDB5275747.1 acetyltransferase [Ferruginibacter sp.]
MIRSIENTAHYNWGNNCAGWHLLKSDSLGVIQERMPPDTTEQLHYHTKAQQVFFILSGTATFEINGQRQVVTVNESIHVPEKSLHCIANLHPVDLNFLVISAPHSHGDRVEIVDYSEDLKPAIKTLNYEWLEKYFRVEPGDVIALSDPSKEIIEKGGFIFYAKMNGEIVGTASLLKKTATVFELGKMAITESAQGYGIGKALITHCVNVSKQLSIERLILYSNTILATAIHLYKSFGFVEVALEPGLYERANIKMEKYL